MAQFLIVAFLSWLVVRTLIRLLRRIRWPGKAGLPRLGKFGAVLAVIITAEMVLPSTAITGLERPEPIASRRYLAETSITPAPFTYGVLAENTPWLWRSGVLDRPEMEARLAADIAALEAGEVAYEPDLSALQLGSPRQAHAIRIEAMLDGLRAASDGLDTLFHAGPVMGHAADRFVVEEIAKAVDRKKRFATEANHAAIEASFDYRERFPDLSMTELEESDEYRRLRATERRALSASLEISAALRELQEVSRWDLRVPRALNPDYPFPLFSAPLLTYENSEGVHLQDHSLLDTGPEESNTPAILWRELSEAVTGRQRSAEIQFRHITCGFVFNTGPQLTQMCEVAVPLPLDYDVTGQGCAGADLPNGPIADLLLDGTRRAGDLCKESWAQPHLNMVFGPETVTIYPPVPAPAQGQPHRPAPLSTWFFTLGGEDYPLDVPVTLPWDREPGSLQGLTITHGIRDGVQTPRMWRDFPISWRGDDIVDAIASSESHDNAFISRTLRPASTSFRLLPRILAPGADAPIPGGFAYLYEAELPLRRITLEWLAQDTISDLRGKAAAERLGASAEFCYSNFFVTSRLRAPALYDALLSDAQSTPGPICETLYAAKSVMLSAARSDSA